MGNLQETGQPKDMFAMELLYNNVLPTVNNTGDEQFNGNIAAIKWNTPEFGVKAYGYGYDNINRLERAKFAAGIALNADVNKYSVENITYDANGNILTLGRHNTAAGYIDNLEMNYNGNQLKKTYDSGDLVLGFVDMVDYETEYHYDLNGNMDIDDNKGFVFAYNYLNLPKEIVGGNDTVIFVYDATGIKLAKELAQGGAISTTTYVGNFVYKDGDLDYILTDEGRITQPTAGTFQYEYFLKDHLGNTRTVFADGNGDGLLADNEVLQENHYYPFGMSIGDLAIDRGADNKLKYNGKELQDDMLGGVSLNLFDYNARYYMPDVPVFTTIDPMVENEHHNYTPYAYAYNNPILYIDPLGLDTTIYVFDQAERPKDNGTKGETYTAEIYIDLDGNIVGPYEGSSYPNSKSNTDNDTESNTIKEGEHKYNNESGHKSGTKKGLNVDDSNNSSRTTTGTSPEGNDVTMTGVNVHQGASDNGNATSRGSKGCITINPNDADAFFSNFDWSKNSSHTKGNSSGTIVVHRGNTVSSWVDKTLINLRKLF